MKTPDKKTVAQKIKFLCEKELPLACTVSGVQFVGGRFLPNSDEFVCDYINAKIKTTEISWDAASQSWNKTPAVYAVKFDGENVEIED